jgi:hypothetical protein
LFLAEFIFDCSAHVDRCVHRDQLAAGLTAYLNLTTAEEHVFGKGDFYLIEPGVVYAQKSAPGAEILFIKVPPGNDKVPAAIRVASKESIPVNSP